MSRSKLRHSKFSEFCSLAAAAFLAAAGSVAQGQTAYYWNASGTAAWSNPANWTPFNGYATVIDNGGTVTIGPGNIASGNNEYDAIYIGPASGNYPGDAGGNGYVKMNGGQIVGATASPWGPYPTEFLGYGGGSGIFTQSGGTNGNGAAAPGTEEYSTVELGPQQGGYGEYQFSGGVLGVAGIYVGSTDST